MKKQRKSWWMTLEEARTNLKRFGMEIIVQKTIFDNYYLCGKITDVDGSEKHTDGGEYHKSKMNEAIKNLHINLLLKGTNWTCKRNSNNYQFSRIKNDGIFLSDTLTINNYENAVEWATKIAKAYFKTITQPKTNVNMNTLYVLVQWPESQMLMDHPRFYECLFVDYLEGHDDPGSSAYMCPKDLYDEIF